jgi:uncharacterized protein YigE (DUF2233 family)
MTRGMMMALVRLAVCLPGLALPGAMAGEPAQKGCAPVSHDENAYTVCRFDVTQHRVELFWSADDKTPYGSFSALEAALQEDGKQLAFAMNAGMYSDTLAPIGLYVEDGKELKKANTRKGPGNFHLMPNGVFYIAGNRAGVLETKRYLKQAPAARLASQSGPMLVIDGKLHPNFRKESTSRKRRNGVGVKDGGRTVVFAISDGVVTFYEFARLFRDKFETPNALFFDGTVSSLHAPGLNRSDWGRPMGPIVGVVEDTKN